MLTWLYDYFVTPTALELRLFRRWTFYRLSKSAIVAIYAARSSRLLSELPPGVQPWNCIAVGNRFTFHGLIVEKEGMPRFLWITPEAPEDFARQLTRNVIRWA